MGLYDFTFHDVIRRNAKAFQDATAWYEVETGRTYSFAEIADAAERLAAGLRAQGVRKGDRIAVVGRNSIEFFLIYGAAAVLGAIVVPINWRLSPAELHFNLNDGEPQVIFSDVEFAERVRDRPSAPAPEPRLFTLHGEADGFAPFADLAATTESAPPLRPAAGTQDSFVMIHTAAVTGQPSGALLSHGNLACACLHWNYYLKTTARDVHLSLLPLFHIAGLVMAAQSFQAGAVNVNLRKFDADAAAALIAERSVSQAFDFTPILGTILDAAEKNGARITSLQCVAGLEKPDVIERYQEVTGGTFYSLYGQTETASLTTIAPYSERPGSAGRPVMLAAVRLVDEADAPVPAGQTGEIVVRGPLVFQGYWRQPSQTQQTFRDGWHHTGDTGRFDTHGYLWYTGRKPEKELIKPGGENVYPAEVEKVILEHPAVAQTAVIGVPDPRWKEGIKAVCRLHPGARLSAAELIAFVGERIARFKKPQYVSFVDTLPLRADGTPDRAKIREQYGGAQDDGTAGQTPESG